MAFSRVVSWVYKILLSFIILYSIVNQTLLLHVSHWNWLRTLAYTPFFLHTHTLASIFHRNPGMQTTTLSWAKDSTTCRQTRNHPTFGDRHRMPSERHGPITKKKKNPTNLTLRARRNFLAYRIGESVDLPVHGKPYLSPQCMDDFRFSDVT